MQKITRDEAKESRLKYYFTGDPCSHGHSSKRFTNSGQCWECWSAYKGSPAKAKKCVVCGASFQAGGFGTGSGSHSKITCSPECCVERQVTLRRAAGRRRYAKEPQKRRLQAKNRRAVERAALALLKKWGVDPRQFISERVCTVEDIERIRKQQKNGCADPTCRKPLPESPELDHIIPLSRGGTNDPRNIQLLCSKSCNSRKGSFDPIEYARRNGMLL